MKSKTEIEASLNYIRVEIEKIKKVKWLKKLGQLT